MVVEITVRDKEVCIHPSSHWWYIIGSWVSVF